MMIAAKELDRKIKTDMEIIQNNRIEIIRNHDKVTEINRRHRKQQL